MDFRKEKRIPPILVLGVGNLLQCDDGVGCHAITELQKRKWPADVELFDGATLGLDLITIMRGRKTVIVIDAVDGGDEPGTIYRFTPDDIPPDFTGYDSLHQIGLIETLHMAALEGSAPERAVIIGIQPGVIDWNLELTEPVRNAVSRVIPMVAQEVEESQQLLRQEQSIET